MADYFTRFSLVLNLPDPEQQQYALDLAAKAAAHRFDSQPQDFPASLADLLENWAFETEQTKDGVWLHSEEGGVDAVCAFIQHLLQRFNLSDRVAFEWSHDCTQPRTDAYGGGAALITAAEIKSISTANWLSTLNPL